MQAVVTYKINNHDAYHKKHFAHSEDRELHQTVGERAVFATTLSEHFRSHESLDDTRFDQMQREMISLKADMRSDLQEIRSDIKAILLAVEPDAR